MKARSDKRPKNMAWNNYWSWFGFVFCGYLLTYTEASSLIIKPEGTSILRAEEQSVVFTCKALGVSQETDCDLRWYNVDGTEINLSSGSRVYIESDEPTTLKLYITNIVPRDGGTYECRGNVLGNPQTARIQLDIYKDITFEHAPLNQHPEIYTDALIECRVDGKPEPMVSFRRDGVKVKTGDRYMLKDNGLMVRNITMEDDGEYVCRAEVMSNGNMEDRIIMVEVYVPPKIVQGPGHQEGIQGHEVSLYCKATGKPVPKYEFYKGSNEFQISSDNRISIDRDDGAIHFRPLMKEDEGQYRCRAVNDLTDDIEEGMLTVIVPPEITTLNNVTVVDGEAVNLVCIAEADPPATMTFQKVGSSTRYVTGGERDGNIRVVNSNDNRLELRVSGSSRHDTGNYTCRATNTGGVDERNGTVTVQFSPMFENLKIQDVYNWPGKRLNVTCHSLAEPTPHVTWWRGNNRLENNITYHIFDMGHSSSLLVFVRDVDVGWIFGEYTCRSRNDLGSADKLFNLVQASAPAVPTHVTLKDHTPTTVRFTVTPPEDDGGMPVTGFRVFYEHHTADFSLDQDILIENLRPATSYVFRFSARNEVDIGPSEEVTHTTGQVRAPYPIEVVSSREGTDPYRYTITWELPRTGGVAIIEYIFKIRQVQVGESQGVWTVLKPMESFSTREVANEPSRPMQAYTLTGLKQNSYYEVTVQARNDIGQSLPNDPSFLFRTAADPLNPAQSSNYGPPSSLSSQSLGLSTSAIIGIVIAIFLLFLVIVDVSCYFMNDCGVLMCMCVHLCGKQDGLLKEKAMEEGENCEKKPLSGGDHDSEVDPGGEDGANPDASGTPRTIWRGVMDDLRDRLNEDADETEEKITEEQEAGLINDVETKGDESKEVDRPISEHHIGELNPEDKPELIS